MDTRYFTLNDDIGLHYKTGEPEPIKEIGLVVAIPRMKGNKFDPGIRRISIEAIPGTRTIKTNDPIIANALAAAAALRESDPPKGGAKGAPIQTTMRAGAQSEGE